MSGVERRPGPPGRGERLGCRPRVSLCYTLDYSHVLPPGEVSRLSSERCPGYSRVHLPGGSFSVGTLRSSSSPFRFMAPGLLPRRLCANLVFYAVARAERECVRADFGWPGAVSAWVGLA
jgi:hypothetical protein